MGALLCYAAERNEVDAVRTLTRAGASVSHVDDRGRMPIHFAADSGDVALLFELVSAGSPYTAASLHNPRPLSLHAL
jgi:ankyrin repeat protein